MKKIPNSSRRLSEHILRALNKIKKPSTAGEITELLNRNLNESRFQGGIASEVEVEQAKTILQTTRAQAFDVGVARSQYEHAVAILIGRPPAEFSLPPLPLTAPPPHIPVGVPSVLLERRPDIAAAERLVASANAQIGVAKSAYYPTISLGASGGFESSSITTLLNGPSGLWSIGLSAVGTVFDVGRRRALNDQARAAYDSQVANYRESVITAFQQVEDNLAAVRILENEAQVCWKWIGVPLPELPEPDSRAGNQQLQLQI
jgi:NodT family efflux transporter outer membrane factor (OMF) lipoprotein